MNLNISYSQKDAAKAAFRAAGIPLTWNAADKIWQTSASDLPTNLAHYAPTAQAPVQQSWVYLALSTGNKKFPYRVVFRATSVDELVRRIEAETYHFNWTALSLVRANKQIGEEKSLPADSIMEDGGYLIERLNDSKMPERRALAARLIAQSDADAQDFAYQLTH